MSETMTYGATIAALHQLDQDVQVVENDRGQCRRATGGMYHSQEALKQALVGFQLDRRTLAAADRLQEATGALQELLHTAETSAREITAHMSVALESVGEHRRLAEAVQGHGEAANMPFYRGGR